MDTAYLLDWLNLLLRWLHVVTGIAWIGASFYFVWLDNSLKPPKDRDLIDKGVSGELWAVHGGGFYNPQKYMVAPAHLPEELHWFKWESYSTWMSGFALLGFLYYLNAGTYLVDKSVLDITPVQAVLASLGFLAGGWVVYDLLCRSALAKHEALLGLVIYAFLVACAYALTHVFSGRAAFLHMGAMIATIMTANVLMVIIPGQRKVVAQMRAGQPVNPVYGQRGKQRSVHNNYFTLPVLFAMLSNHYAFTYSSPHAWLLMALVLAAGVLMRLYFNLAHKGKRYWAIWAVV
ncbi:MAG: urate hydroxylase PuuD, partial [Betaproteobacteria bacterium]|nr:urate hydroxylase PuuD [Betaproteobacteria bacterium]